MNTMTEDQPGDAAGAVAPAQSVRVSVRRSSRWPVLIRRLRIAVLAIAVLLAILALLFVSVRPEVQGGQRPTARDIAAAREAWHQVRDARGTDEATRVRFDNRMIRGLGALASDATGKARFEGQVADGVLSGKSSVRLPAGLWLNVSGTVTGRHQGFPALRLKVGRVTFPLAAGRWAADFGRLLLRLRGATIPPLDEMVRRFNVNRADVLAEVVVPGKSGMVGGLIASSGEALNQPLVSDIYCEIAASQREEPVSDLSQMVRRTFGKVRANSNDEHVRAAFVALSFLVVGEQAKSLAPRAAELAKNCPRPFGKLHLQGREDLAKHWTFSAAIAAVLGEETSTSVGEWKELDDSLANGSGFSFVDIAADRAGLQTALRALDPATAEQTVGNLARATEESLLPGSLLRGPEGLSETTFTDRFGSLDRQRYRQAIVAIDRELARGR
jgi:hypothetical protein